MFASLQNNFANYRTRLLRIDIEENIITKAFSSLRFDTLASPQRSTYPMAATVYTWAVAPITDFEVVTQRKVHYVHVFLLHPCPPSMFLLSVSFFAHYIFSVFR
jgi:hypothetical protein